jgi:peptide-methionine (S)-S-oxide reductase
MRQKNVTLNRLFACAALAAMALAAQGPASVAAPAAAHLETAVFAGGCFWTMEHGLEDVPGVVKAVSGYSGGRIANPSYEQVSSETTGHLESVKVTFDPAKISYATLVDRYWHMIDPTDADGMVCDQGPSYHSAIFVSTPVQRKVAEASKAQLQVRFKGRVATEIRAAAPFYPAETYHQGYARKNPVAYGAYKVGCGRDTVLMRIWGAVPKW